jgi:hypothetical protein
MTLPQAHFGADFSFKRKRTKKPGMEKKPKSPNAGWRVLPFAYMPHPTTTTNVPSQKQIFTKSALLVSNGFRLFQMHRSWMTIPTAAISIPSIRVGFSYRFPLCIGCDWTLRARD